MLSGGMYHQGRVYEYAYVLEGSQAQDIGGETWYTVPLDDDGMPPHGYGIRSVRAAAQKYGGMVTVHCQDNWFVLRVLLPRKEADAKK